MQEKKFNNDDSGSIGIGAMIVFIALILVAAVASAVIIQTGEKLQQNAQKSGDDTQREISGKITLNSAFVVADDVVRFYFESAPGSGVLAVDDVIVQITCDNPDAAGDGTATTTGDGYNFIATAMSDGDANAEVNEAYLMSDPNDIGGTVIAQLNPGQSYMIDIDVEGALGSDCAIDELGVNGEMTVWIHVQGGGSSYETLYISSTAAGTLLI